MVNARIIDSQTKEGITSPVRRKRPVTAPRKRSQERLNNLTTGLQAIDSDEDAKVQDEIQDLSRRMSTKKIQKYIHKEM